MSLLNNNITIKKSVHLEPLNYEPNEYSNIYPNPMIDKEIIAILQDKPCTLLQLNPFFPNQSEVLRMRLIDLCSKGVLRKVYNGNLYYQLKKQQIKRTKPQIILMKGRSKRVFDLSHLPVEVGIPKGYTYQDYRREKLSLNSPVVLSFKDGSFKNPKFLTEFRKIQP